MGTMQSTTAPSPPSGGAPGARPGAFAPLTIGPYTQRVPVVLAPMAGITNQAYRRLCRRHAGPSGGFFVSEMVTSRALVERNDESLRLIRCGADENPRSVQLYAVDPAVVAEAVRIVVGEDHADHIDLNFGCPVPKVTRRGGGAALPWKSAHFAAVVGAAVRAAAPAGVPVTVKMRMGVDPDHITYREAGRAAEGEGAAAVALHARTATQYYAGTAHWQAVADLKQVVTTVPVLGNGNVWTADDALRLVRETGCDGVVVGRGCLGRPWLFADLAAAFSGSDERVRPGLGQVLQVMREHLDLLVDHYREAAEEAAARGGPPTHRNDPAQAEDRACRDFRKHVAWYFKGYRVPHHVRAGLAQLGSTAQFDEIAGQVDPLEPYPGAVAEGARGRTRALRWVALPPGWLDSRELDGEGALAVGAAETESSGG